MLLTLGTAAYVRPEYEGHFSRSAVHREERNDISDHIDVVTEHGVAYLHGKTLRERAGAHIAVADPMFRDELYEFACRKHYLRPIAVPARSPR